MSKPKLSLMPEVIQVQIMWGLKSEVWPLDHKSLAPELIFALSPKPRILNLGFWLELRKSVNFVEGGKITLFILTSF